MKLQTIKSGAKLALGNAKLFLKKNAPDILMATGVVSIIGGTVLACHATLKAQDVLSDHEDMMLDIENAAMLNDGTEIVYSAEDEKKDKITAYTRTTFQMMKLYTPAVIFMSAGLACVLSAHGIMKKRNVALMTAYSTLHEAFSNYRDRVRQKVGMEEEKRLYLGADEVKKIGEVDEKTGEYEEKLEFKGPADLHPSPYAVWFDESSTEWKKDASLNKFFLTTVQNWCNDLLQVNGHLFLNEVYKMLGLPETSIGAIAGWLKDVGDGYVDFGMYDVEKPVYADGRRDFINGYERCVLLDFNAIGSIYEDI